VSRATALLLALTVTGCGFGESQGSIDPARRDALVLQPADLPAGYRRSEVDLQPLVVRYRWTGDEEAVGVLVVESTAQVFASKDEAEEALATEREELDSAEPEWQPIGEPGLGDESFAATVLTDVRYYRVHWRAANAFASLRIEGTEGELALEHVLELARTQERRMSEAVSDA
jgi:hypothetical protein